MFSKKWAEFLVRFVNVFVEKVVDKFIDVCYHIKVVER